jgi:DNA-binding Lrp family transcriptional regulator
MNTRKLSATDRLILAAVHLDANRPIATVARLAGVRAHTVQYTLACLREGGLIRRRPMVDVHRLGYTQYALFLDVRLTSEGAKERLLGYFSESRDTSDVFEIGGEFQYGVVLTVDEFYRVPRFLGSVARIPGVELLAKAFTMRLSTCLAHRGYLGELAGVTGRIEYRHGPGRVEIDELDHRILGALYRHPQTSGRDLARSLGLPGATFHHRLKKLEREGVILGYVYGMNAAALGMHRFRVLVSARGFEDVSWEELARFAEHHPNVVCLIQCLGDWDYEFEVEVEEPHEVNRLAQEIAQLFKSSAASTRTVPLFRFPKASAYPFSLGPGPG